MKSQNKKASPDRKPSAVKSMLKSLIALLNPIDIAAVLLIIIVSAWFIIPSSAVLTVKFEEGDIASSNIYAPMDIIAKDVISTERKRDAAFNSAKDIYDLNLIPLNDMSERIDKAFAMIKDAYMAKRPNSYRFVLSELDESELLQFDKSDEMEERRKAFHESINSYENRRDFLKVEKRFYETLGMKLSDRTKRVLKWHHYRPEIGDWLKSIISEIWQRGVVKSRADIPKNGSKEITVIPFTTSGTEERRTGESINGISTLSSAKKRSRQRADSLVSRSHPSLRRELAAIAEKIIVPNIAYNEEKTEAERELSMETVETVLLKMKKGETIIRGGERVTREELLKLEAVRDRLGQAGKSRKFQSIAGTVLFLTLIILSSIYYLYTFIPEIGRNRADMMLLGLMLLVQISLLHLFSAGASVFSLYKTDLAFSTYLYAAPFALAPMLASIFYNREITVLVAIASALTAGFMFGASGEYFWLALAGGLASLIHVGRIKVRADIWYAGLHLVLANMAVILVGGLLDSSVFTDENLNNLLFGALGGLLVVAFSMTLLPLIERFFPVVSDLKLLELSDLNHPLLSRMAVVAPGTYHHSIVVGNLAEDAAEAIGASPLLVRVGAYFHDIGKMERPDYYIENQREGKNRHDNLNPSMSSLIIVSHVTDGLEMAKKYKLIPQISDMITEHHGTQTIRYFYQRAKDREQPSVSAVKEQDFKYPGEIPKSRESAILALADSVEAATRSLQKPTSTRLRQVVFKIIQERFLEGQLDKSQLTLRDMKKIGNSFVRILHGIFHYRVEYPEDKENDENIDFDKIWSSRAEQDEDTKEASDNFGGVG
jgi:hypothetical protein